MISVLSDLVTRLGDSRFPKMGVIPWSCPVLSFGDLMTAKVATLGLNPSNREFVDHLGNELTGGARRFETLTSLGLRRWSDATAGDIGLVLKSCRTYFARNPYDAWFKQMDSVLAASNVSYYRKFEHACHLDLVPYATVCKWSSLTSRQRSELLRAAGNILGHLLRESSVQVLVLNGSAVITHFQAAAEVELRAQVMREWFLRRESDQHVKGIAYTGRVNRVMGVELRRELLVLGFNHNIQSSFGVTRKVRAAIGNWVGQLAIGAAS
jgi:hypothetical protein